MTQSARVIGRSLLLSTTMCFTLGFTLVAGAASAGVPLQLPALQTDSSQVSVSGLSSGAFMAAQYQVAYSASVMGAGIVAGGPFYCSGSMPMAGYAMTAMTVCMKPPFGMGPDASVLLNMARVFNSMGSIDDLSNLSKQHLYVFSGKDDKTVTTTVVDQTVRFFKLAGIPAKNISYVTNVDAGHAIVTATSTDTACAVTAAPYINNCNFSQAQAILTQIYGKLAAPATMLTGKLIQFDQNAFSTSANASMSDSAYLYVPLSCQTQSCRVHVAFHGCQQGATVIGDQFYSGAGYNEVADTNNIVMLYPQVQESKLSPMNPQGCWDFWGYSSPIPALPNFYTRAAPQMAAVKAMLDRLAQPRGTPLVLASGD